MRIFLISAFFLLFPPLWWHLGHSQHLDLTFPEETRSRMIMVDGNMFFVAGSDRNITFRVSTNSSIRFGDTDIMQLPNSTEVGAVRQLLANVKNQLGGVYANMEEMESNWQRKHAEMMGKHVLIAQQMAVQLNDSQNRAKANRRVRMLIVKLSKQIERLFKMMGTDECLGAPCKNGGTCIDGFGKFQCLCPGHFQGKLCDERVDECALYGGGDTSSSLGCKNNATCTNNPSTAGFTCNCTSGWHGHRCDHKENSCETGSDICGEHGHCVPNTQSAIGYRCLCEAGFKLGGDPANPICVDIDECAQSNPCYPGADCLNLPGSFKCGSCPSGLIGNGLQCVDFDECAIELTNDCSKEPPVECVNTHGGYKCGTCPPEYEGDGFNCAKVSACAGGGICHPQARCMEEPEFRCECPEGTMGDGIGPAGCVESDETACAEDTCQNGGTCQTISFYHFRCICPEGYQGQRCEQATLCLSRQFCSGNGRCRTSPQLGCDCFKGFYGPRCQYEEDAGCGFHTSNETGELVYERTAPSPLFNRWTCTWHIQLFDTRKVLSIQFLNLTAPRLYEITSKTCDNSFVTLTVFDGADPGDSPELASSKIANFCHGEDFVAPFKHPLFTSSNKAVIRLSSRLQGRSTYLRLNWTASEPRCGGRLSNPAGGRIDFFELAEEETCVWYVNVPPQFHIELSVDALRLPTGSTVNCSINSLELFDSPLLANRTRALQLCSSLTSTESPTIVRTSGPFAAIYLRNDRSLLTNNDIKCDSPPCVPFGFSLRYSTIELPSGCGGEIFSDGQTGELSGLIQSPNFPHTYFPNLDCLWILKIGRANESAADSLNGTAAIVASNSPLMDDPYFADQKVEIFFEQFDVPETVTQYANPLLRHVTISSCSGDFVQIAELDQTYCNLQKPPNSPIAAPQISLKFHSDATIGGKGFALRYRSVCQKDFADPNGTISSPNFPASSPRPFKCTYRIQAQPSQAIRLRFNKIGLSTDFGTCFYNRERHSEMQDYITLSGGHPSNEVANKRYVCPRYPFVAPDGEIVTSGTKAFSITYSTSGSAHNKGFLFSYELIDIGCGGVFNIGEEEASGIQRPLTSPNYPEPYMALMYCVYFLRVPPGKGLRLAFDVFDVENVAHREECEFDNVRVYDTYTDEDEHGQLLGKFCGKSLPPPLLSNSGQMALVFISDRSVSGAGFSAKFQAVDLAIHCDRTFTAPSGQFSFDSAQFEQAEHCDYRIQIPTNRRILLSILNISAPCEFGTLMVRNGPSLESPGFPGLFRHSEICDDHLVSRLISQGNRLFLRFQAGSTRSLRFSIQYEQFDTGCGGHVSGFSGALSSPQFPHKDSQSLRCEWLVAVAPGNSVRLQIVQMDELDSEDSQGRCSPFGRNLLEVADGSDWTELLQRFCRHELSPVPVQSRANSLSVRFTQHGGSHHPPIFGFLAQFSTVCADIVLEGQQGTLQSPGYPQPVDQARSCHWTIRTSPGSRIQLQFHLFRITDSLASRHSRSDLYIRVSPWASGICRRNYLEIDPTSVRRLTGTKGGEMAFSLNETANKATIPRRFCLGVVEPTELLSEHNQLELDFQSRNEPENHFWLSWRTIGCGGLVTQNNSLLVANASEGADFVSTDHLRKCVWQIRAPFGNSIQIVVERMETEAVPNGKKCFELKTGGDVGGSEEKAELRDGVQFYAGDFPFDRLNSGAELPLKALCGRVQNESFAWSGPTLAVVFTYHADTSRALADTIVGALFNTLDEIDDHLMLRARVTFRPMEGAAAADGGQKGGVIHVDARSDSFIQSPNYPQPYPKSVELTWQFDAPEGFCIAFQLLNLSSPGNALLGYGRAATSRLLNSSDPEDYNCGYHLLYLRGGLMFNEGAPTSNLLSSSQSRYRICQEVQLRPVNITMNGNLSIVTFRGAPYDQIIAPSGDSTATSSGASTGGQKAVGFRLRAFAKCGGQLWASGERKLLDMARMGAEQECEWSIKMGRDDGDEQAGQKIFVRVEEMNIQQGWEEPLRHDEPGTAPQLEVFCGLESKGVVEAGELRPLGQGQHFRQFSCDGEVRLVGTGMDTRHDGHTFLVTYDTEQTFCGGQLSGHDGRLALNPIPAPSDCEWTLDAVPGSHVVVHIATLVLPISEYCSDSFLEFREANASGQLIGRYCGIFPPTLESQGPLWIRLRHKIEEGEGRGEEARGGDDGREEGREMAAALMGDGNKVPAMELKYEKAYGLTNSHLIESPPAGLSQPISWRIATADPEHWILFRLVQFQLAPFSASLTIHPRWCSLLGSPATASEEDVPCQDADPSALRFSALSPPEKGRLYTIPSNRVTLIFWPNLYGQLQLRWEEIGQNRTDEGGRGVLEGQEEGGDGGQRSDGDGGTFTCGGELVPQYEPQTLNSPKDPQSIIWYKNNERCKWTLRRPQFASILLNVTSLELESHPSCQYDWLALSPQNYATVADLANVPEMMRICRKLEEYHQKVVEVNSADQAFIYFYTDRSRTFRGFSLAYSLSCNSIELWPPEKGLLDTHLGWPPRSSPISSAISENRTCQWSILLLSRRDILIQAVHMDMAPRDWQTQECVTDSLEFSATPFYGDHSTTNQSMVHCGHEKFNMTIGGGYLFIRFRKGPGGGLQGFNLRLSEVVHDCASSLIQLDQVDPLKVVSSPNFPQLSPDSLDCQWILSAPPGRRLQFTIDPTSFSLQNPISDDRCEEDFLEIRDGPSPASPLLGRFCKETAPSTIFSTGEHLNLRYVTDSEIQSAGWNGTVEVATCGGSLVLVQGQNATLHSPNYPDVYPSKVRCEWTVRAPKGHFVVAMMDHFWLASTDNCTAEYVEVRDKNATGDFLQKPVCSRLALSNGGLYRSRHQSLHLLFAVDGISTGRTNRLFCLSRKCGFQLRLWPTKFACGGTIADDSGTISPPAYPDQLVAGLFCQWDFRAGIGHRYLLQFERPQDESSSLHIQPEGGGGRNGCFWPLQFFNGFPSSEIEMTIASRESLRLFCPPNRTSIVSKSDIASLVYNLPRFLFVFGKKYSTLPIDNSQVGPADNNNRPFLVKYTKVPIDFDNSSCMFELTEAGNLSIGQNLSPGQSDNSMRTQFCHIQIRKPSADHTVHLLFSNITFGSSVLFQKSYKCHERQSRIIVRDEFAAPTAFEAILCPGNSNGANQTAMVLLNSQLEIYVQNLLAQVGIRFELAVNFHECGGLIDAERVGMSGELSSPGFGVANYSNGLECLWLLRAPEGKIVSLEFTTMDLEHHIECGHDVLQVIAGEHHSASFSASSAVLHRYCNSETADEKLPERFRRIRSLGPSLSLYFHTDASVVGRGFSLQFAFVSPNDQCGFHANSPNGTVRSPGYPDDYPPNSQCIWDIQVSPGFHLLLTFTLFDIVQSPDCTRDFLKISEEHQSRAVSPLLSYYFYFDHESPGQQLCGNVLPAPIRTESNRVRLNFTSDGKKSARGFQLHWQAVCGGAVFRNNHGVLTSPHYPAFYPNEDAECQYLIDPETQAGSTQIVTLKVLDLDLDRDPPSSSSPLSSSIIQRFRGRFCVSDYLEIRDVLRNVTVQLLCGATFKAEAAEAVSIKGPIGVRFVTNHSSEYDRARKQHRGFKLSYALSECGGDIQLGEQPKQSSVTITSPSFPLPYHHGLDCIWNISAPVDRIIAYKFTDLKIEPDPNCQFDAVETFDGTDMAKNGSRQIVLCGDKAPEGELKSSGPNMLVHFRSDHSASFGGFRMVLTATLGPSSGCGGWLNASKEWQKLGAPIDPQSGNHYANLRCEWIVQAPPGKVVEVQIKALELEQKPDAAAAAGRRREENASIPLADRIPCFDFAAIYDGPKATSPFLLFPSCTLPANSAGDPLPPPTLVSSHRRVDVFFSADSSLELAGGFQAEFRAVPRECGGPLLAGQDWANVTYSSERTLTRTNQRHKRCRWHIYSDQSQPVEVVFEQFSFPSATADCVDEYLEMQDVGAMSECEHPACAREAHQSRERVRSCGKFAPNWHISSTSVLQLTASILLQSQFTASFQLRFRALSPCNRTVEIDGTAPDGVSLASGRLTSPHFPHAPYSHNSSCTTQIVAAEGHRILLVFKTFQLERGRMTGRRPGWRFDRGWRDRRRRREMAERPGQGEYNCIYDALLVFANDNSSVPLAFCGTWLPPSILSESNQVQLVLKTDATVAGSGYELAYFSTTISRTPSMQMFQMAPSRERSGALTSIGYPGPYPANSLMRASIAPPPGLSCIAKVLMAEFGGDCRARVGRFPARSALLPQDAASRDTAALANLDWNPWPCSVDSPMKLPIPPGNELIVEFRADSDPQNDGIGFRMHWDCEDMAGANSL